MGLATTADLRASAGSRRHLPRVANDPRYIAIARRIQQKNEADIAVIKRDYPYLRDPSLPGPNWTED